MKNSQSPDNTQRSLLAISGVCCFVLMLHSSSRIAVDVLKGLIQHFECCNFCQELEEKIDNAAPNGVYLLTKLLARKQMRTFPVPLSWLCAAPSFCCHACGCNTHMNAVLRLRANAASAAVLTALHSNKPHLHCSIHLLGLSPYAAVWMKSWTSPAAELCLIFPCWHQNLDCPCPCHTYSTFS